MNVLGYNDRVRFTLKSKKYNSMIIDEPIGWETDDKEFTRSEYHGIFINMSNNLTFVGNAVDYIQLVKKTEGIKAQLRLTKDERHPETDEWIQTYSGYLDMTTYQEENNQIKLKFNSGGLESILKSRESQMVEIDRVDTIDGKKLNTIPFSNILLGGRSVYLESTWKASSMSYHKELWVQSKDGNTRSTSNTFPFEIVKKSQEQAKSLYDGPNGHVDNGQETMMLLSIVDRKREFTIDIENIKFNCFVLHDDVDWGEVVISLVKYTQGINYVRDGSSVKTLWFAKNDNKLPPIYRKGLLSGNYTIPDSSNTFVLNEGESLGLEVLLRCDLRRGAAAADFNYKILEGKISIKENSVFKSSICKAVKPFDLASMLIEVITNEKDVVKSEILKTGKWKDLMISHGFWIRGFSREKDLELKDEDRKFKPLTTCFKDFISSFSAVCNIGLGIEKKGYKENLIIEDLSYFYNQNITIRLPNPIKNVKRYVESEKYYKNIEIGYEKGGEYEEAMGLDEYNVKNSYTTTIDNVSNSYNQISKYRADTYGIEFARRKPFSDYSTQDTSYDQDIFMFDCKTDRLGLTHVVRLWKDDFLNKPSGVFSPETAYNLRLSPFNNLLRHGWVINSGLTLYPADKIKYASSTGNSNLITEYAENGEIQNSKLKKPRFLPDIIEFEHEVNIDLSQQIIGYTTLLDKTIPNVYGLIEFINEDNNIERGYLMSVKPNGEGKWKLLKSTR